MQITFLGINASYSHTNYAFQYLKDYAINAADSWRLVEYSSKEFNEKILSDLLSVESDYLFATLYIFNRPKVLEILERFHQLSPTTKILVGGPELLGDNRELLTQYSFINAAIRGEGELPTKVLLNDLDNFYQQPGVCHIQDGDYIDLGLATTIDDLDQLPAVSLDHIKNKPFVQYETSRGCPNSCSFCTSSVGSGVRFKSIEKIEVDLATIAKAEISEVRILDRTFNRPSNRAIELLKLFREKFPNQRFHLEFDPAFISEALFNELSLATSENLHLECGVQTLIASSVATMQRHSSIDKTIAGLSRLCKLDNIEIHADLLAGLPKTNYATLVDSLLELLKISPNEIQLEIVKILPGTPLETEAKEHGISYSKLPPYEILQSADWSWSELQKAMRLSRIIDWFYNYQPLRSIIKELLLTIGVEPILEHLAPRVDFYQPLTPKKRFLLLQDLVNDELFIELVLSWCREGFSPEHGPIAGRRYTGEWNEFELVSGDPATLESRRSYLLEFANCKLLIAYHNGPASAKEPDLGVWRFR